MSEKTQWYIGAPNGVVLCIDHRGPGGILSGRMWDSYSLDPIPFDDMERMALDMERLYDSLSFPHPEVNARTFLPEEHTTPAGRPQREERIKIMSDEKLLGKHGDIGTFIVRVQHRQNSSMQGRITWMEQDKTISFRSAWEMIKLIESAVESVVPDTEAEKEPGWFDGEEK